MPQENDETRRFMQTPLSNIWLELLGNSSTERDNASVSNEPNLPVLKSDPWSELLQSRNVEMLDLQQLNLHMSDQDVELALEVMQEQPAQNPENNQTSAS